MKKRDIDNYNKSQKIIREIIHKMNNPEESDNIDELSSFIKTNSYSKEFLEKSCSEEKFKFIHDNLQDAESNQKLDLFLRKLDAARPARPKNYVKRGLVKSVTAAAVILIAALIYYNGNRGKEQIVAENVKKPMLILGDGNKIDLEKYTQDVIKNNDIVIVKESNQIRYSSGGVEDGNHNRLIVPQKYSYSIILSDGSEVCLNAASELVYPKSFGKDIREVELSGEAYFKVKKSELPFVVRVNGVSIRVYGTEFNVNSNYTGIIETTLISGSVGVKPDNSEEIMIKPNQLITVDKHTKKCVVQDVDVENYISWMNGYFRYTNYSFTSIINDISLWYGVKIDISNELISSELTATMSISRDISLEETLRFVEKIMGVKIINEGGGQYIISR